jgi:hypothetical protein
MWRTIEILDGFFKKSRWTARRTGGKILPASGVRSNARGQKPVSQPTLERKI